MTYRCEHAVRYDDSGVVPDKSHSDACNECRAMVSVDRFFEVLGEDELSPTLPNPKLIMLKAELVRQNQAFEEERATTRWAGVSMWGILAIVWIAILASNVGGLVSALEPFGISLADANPMVPIIALLAFIGGCAIFATAIHSVLAEM